MQNLLNFYLHCIDPDIGVHLTSLLVPLNTEAVFTCQVSCIGMCDIYWIIRNTIANPHHRSQFEKQGYIFNNNEVNGTYTARVAVNSSLGINGTPISVLCNTGWFKYTCSLEHSSHFTHNHRYTYKKS